MFVNHRANAGTITAKTAPPSASASKGQEIADPGLPADVADLSSAGDPPKSSGFGKAAAVLGLGVVAAGLTLGTAAPAEAHGWNRCGWQTQSSIQYDNWGNAHSYQESYNSCTGEHTVARDGYIVNHHFDNPRVGHQHGYGHGNGHHRHGHGHHQDGNDAAAGFLFGLGLGIILGQ
ncbi:MAG: hypothetical protein AB7S38_09135 [Vulcanimicrobiota bacterium]